MSEINWKERAIAQQGQTKYFRIIAGMYAAETQTLAEYVKEQSETIDGLAMEVISTKKRLLMWQFAAGFVLAVYFITVALGGTL